MTSIIFFAILLWYGTIGFALVVGIYATIYFANVLDITRKQFFLSFFGGIVLAIVAVIFHYVTSIHMQASLYDDIISYTALTIGSIIIVCLVYFIIVGKRNLSKNYGLDINGLWPWEIKRQKELHK